MERENPTPPRSITVTAVVPKDLIDDAMRRTGRTQSETVRLALARLVGAPDDVAFLTGWPAGRPRRRPAPADGEQAGP